MKFSEFAAAVGAELENGGADFVIAGMTTIESAQAGEVALVGKPAYAAKAPASGASGFIAPPGLAVETAGRPVARLANPVLGVKYLLEQLYPSTRHVWFEGVHPAAVVHPDAEIHPEARIGPGAVVGPRVRVGARSLIGENTVIESDVTIGDDCHIHPRVTIGHHCVLGDRVLVLSGVVIGSDGFKHELIKGRWTKIPQVGNVVIGNDVEIGANTTIDRASYTVTTISENTKIDNLVQIAHNVTIGANCLIVSQSGIAGSAKLGENCIIAAQAGVADNVTLGKGVMAGGCASIKDNLPDGAMVIGTPARNFRQQAKIWVIEGRLPEIAKEVTALRAELDALKAQIAAK